MERKAVAAVVIREGRVLVGKKRDDGRSLMSGKWHIPGETLEPDETDEAGLRRGIKEETGVEIRVSRRLASHTTPKGTLVTWYECEPLSFNIKPGSDLDEVKWVSREEVAELCCEPAKSLWPPEIQEYFQK